MSKLRLPSGFHVILGVFHEKLPHTNQSQQIKRKTVIKCTFTDSTFTKEFGTLTAMSVCIPPDNFCKATGRKLAARRLISNNIDILDERGNYRKLNSSVFTKEDKRVLMKAICPELTVN